MPPYLTSILIIVISTYFVNRSRLTVLASTDYKKQVIIRTSYQRQYPYQITRLRYQSLRNLQRGLYYPFRLTTKSLLTNIIGPSRYYPQPFRYYSYIVRGTSTIYESVRLPITSTSITLYAIRIEGLRRILASLTLLLIRSYAARREDILPSTLTVTRIIRTLRSRTQTLYLRPISTIVLYRLFLTLSYVTVALFVVRGPTRLAGAVTLRRTYVHSES